MKKTMFSLFNDFIVLSKVSVPLTVLTANRVSNFCDKNEVLSAISSSPEGFHVAILVVSISNQEVLAGEGKKKPPPSSCYQRLIMEPPSSPLHMSSPQLLFLTCCHVHLVKLIHVAMSVKDAKVSHFPIAGFQGDSKEYIDPIN
ncbi:uncharacterized protein LOC114168773 isoform X3 [Vigna unguiculata]|uniref:uncharacterized protein LOC114168773 isoform X3 n=1 Tax=Vigna unguiculata TaxID=3917 RepID=UPI0010169406|nr:uncharacterized protein LOC114168773 isoform X3 [Vigna unguiculata]